MKSYYDETEETPQPIKSSFKIFKPNEESNKFDGDDFDEFIKQQDSKKTAGRRESCCVIIKQQYETQKKMIGWLFQDKVRILQS